MSPGANKGTVKISGGEALKKLSYELKQSDMRLRVGILEGALYPDGTPTALVGLVHEFGTEDGTTPPRPFMRSTVKQRALTWSQALQSFLKEKDHDIAKALPSLGELMAGDLKQQIIAITEPALKEETVKRKGSAKPLVDTKHLLMSIDYEVKKGKSE